METTVTMSLERYKQLESIEIAFEKAINDPEKFVFTVGWNSTWRCIPHNEAFDEMRKEIEYIKATAEHWRLKAK